MGKGKPAKAGTKRFKKQQRSIYFADSGDDSDVPVRSPTVYEGERADRIAQNERVLGALVSRPLPMAEEIEAAKPTRKRCEPKRLHARSMLSTLLRRCRKAAPARPSQTQQPRALRTRVQAPLAGQGLLTDSADSPAVYAVPRSYWLEDVSCEGAATVHCSVNGTKLIGIYVGEDAGDVELDFGSATKMFPARTAAQWRVQDLQAAQEHLSAYEAARQASSTARRPSPPRESASRSTTVAVSLGSATTRQDEVRDTHGSNPRRVRGRARSVAVPTRDVKIVRPPLAICLPTPVTAPAFVTGQPKKWVEDHKVLIRAWTRASLAGVGLRRNVPSGGAAIPDVELRDALLAPTDGLVAELMEALVTTYGARSDAVRGVCVPIMRACRRYPEFPEELRRCSELKKALVHVISVKRSSMLGAARRLGQRLLGELQQSSEPFTMPQPAFADKTTVGECVSAVLALPPCVAEHQGERTSLGTGSWTHATWPTLTCVSVCMCDCRLGTLSQAGSPAK